MPRLIRSARAKRDIVEVLQFTKRKWGDAQAREYAALIGEALVAIATDPRCGKPLDELFPGLRAYSIRQPGRPARHIVFYRVRATGTVELVRLLHDAMDFKKHVP
jgi:toxin ParE1/3/4